MKKNVRIIPQIDKFFFIINKLEKENLNNPDQREIIFCDSEHRPHPKSRQSYLYLKEHLKKMEKGNPEIKKSLFFDEIRSDKCECHYCEKKLTLDNYSIDHYKPKFFGGLNMFCNIKLSCEDCNHMKGAIHPRYMIKTFDIFKKLRKKDVSIPNLTLLNFINKFQKVDNVEKDMLSILIKVEKNWMKDKYDNFNEETYEVRDPNHLQELIL